MYQYTVNWLGVISHVNVELVPDISDTVWRKSSLPQPLKMETDTVSETCDSISSLTRLIAQEDSITRGFTSVL
jgi:hypothetical protein